MHSQIKDKSSQIKDWSDARSNTRVQDAAEQSHKQANRASNDQNCTATQGLGARFVEGYLTNILNPKPAFFYLAAFPQFIDIDGLPFIIQGMALGAIHASIAILWYSLIVFGIGTISQWMTRPAFWRLIQTISGTALVALGARLLSMRQAT
jgi:threonine/homoserine/homoserine lactone efflux protein